MFVAKVVGTVVSTQKVEKMIGRKLLIVDPLRVDEKEAGMISTGRSFVAVDSVGAGESDVVLVTQGSSARMTTTTGDAPVDCVVIGIVDSIHAMGNEAYNKSRA
jgi:microcompartment protein CcmK/EutM